MFMTIRLTAIVVVTMVTAARPCASQKPQLPARQALADSTVPRIMAQARNGFPGGAIVDVLRQRGRPMSKAKRDELADSVVALAIRTREAASAIVALASAGRPMETVEDGTPDPRALEWLMRVHRESRDNPSRRMAIHEMVRQVDPSRAIPYLQAVATAPDDPTAWVALDQLLKFAVDPKLGSADERPRRMVELRRMWDRGLVTEPLALANFKRFAFVQGWTQQAGRGA